MLTVRIATKLSALILGTTLLSATSFVAPQVAKAAGCTSADLRGVYGYQISGWIAPVPNAAMVPFSETGRLVISADGTLEGAGAFSLGGQPGTHTFTGPTEVNADCTATAILASSLGVTGTFKIVILESGKDYLFQNVTLGSAVQGRAERQKK